MKIYSGVGHMARCLVAALCLVSCAVRGDEECHVVFACDGAHMAGLEAAMNSVRHSARAFRVAMTVVVPESERYRVPPGARVVTLESTRLANLRIPGYEDFGSEQKFSSFGNLSSRLNYARFFLADIVAHARYVLYLDVDVVVRCDVTWLLRIDAPALFEDYPDAVIAVVDRDRLSIGARSRRRLLYHRGWSFNAGVFVADLHRWRAVDATGQLERAMAAVAEAILARTQGDPATTSQPQQQLPWSRPSSQLPMTRVFDASKVAPLPSEWNRLLRHAQPHDVETMLSNGSTPRYDCAWHFTGPLKPWDYARQNVSHWSREMWEPYASRNRIVQSSAGWPTTLPRTREMWREIVKQSGQRQSEDMELRLRIEREAEQGMIEIENAAEEVRREREAIEADMRRDEALMREREKQIAAKEREKAEKLLRKSNSKKKVALPPPPPLVDDISVPTTASTTSSSGGSSISSSTTGSGSSSKSSSSRRGGGGRRRKKGGSVQRTAEELRSLEQRKKERRAKRAAARARSSSSTRS